METTDNPFITGSREAVAWAGGDPMSVPDIGTDSGPADARGELAGRTVGALSGRPACCATATAAEAARKADVRGRYADRAAALGATGIAAQLRRLEAEQAAAAALWAALAALPDTGSIVRPMLGDAVRVSFPGSLAFDPETIHGVVVDLDGDSIDIRTGEAIGETFTLYDVEQADPAVTVEVLG